jgi:hypothetical protein
MSVAEGGGVGAPFIGVRRGRGGDRQGGGAAEH